MVFPTDITPEDHLIIQLGIEARTLDAMSQRYLETYPHPPIIGPGKSESLGLEHKNKKKKKKMVS